MTGALSRLPRAGLGSRLASPARIESAPVRERQAEGSGVLPNEQERPARIRKIAEFFRRRRPCVLRGQLGMDVPEAGLQGGIPGPAHSPPFRSR